MTEDLPGCYCHFMEPGTPQERTADCSSRCVVREACFYESRLARMRASLGVVLKTDEEGRLEKVNLFGEFTPDECSFIASLAKYYKNHPDKLKRLVHVQR